MIIKSEDGKLIYCESHRVENPRASVVIVHGLGEHCGRYDELTAFFHKLKIDVHSFDLRGHGRTPGTRGHFESLEEIFADIDALFKHLTASFTWDAQLPLYLFGHSLGGLIALEYAERYSQPALHPKLKGLILSAPALAVKLNFFEELQGKLSQALPKFLNTLQVSTRMDPNDLTRDPEEQKLYREDPLVHPWLTPGAYGAIQEGLSNVPQALRSLKVPTLVLLGGKDTIVDTDRIVKKIEKMQRKERVPIEVKIFYSFRHEPFHELRRERAYLELKKWFLKQLPAGKKPSLLKTKATVKLASRNSATIN